MLAANYRGFRMSFVKHPGLVPTLVLAASVSGCAAMPVGNASVPQPAKPVDLSAYAGTWYEMARYENGFEPNCEGVTAQYAARPDGRIKVVNTCHRGSPSGEVKISEGNAKVVAGSRNAKLKVSFFGPFYFGDYWVLDHADDYSWSIVGEPSGKYLWILTRQAHPADTMRNDLVARAQALGYDTKRLHATAQ